ncbi:predicted protein [Histoplasma capsulatum H143]|uniref:Uncharacterized protein n=1 Tax=Ajellomyces capsulatus (strain H143) TaxID=544712 RepID=C6H652_AJECH|nr:predicted protein [Histoplasma capsulatum H143]
MRKEKRRIQEGRRLDGEEGLGRDGAGKARCLVGSRAAERLQGGDNRGRCRSREAHTETEIQSQGRVGARAGAGVINGDSSRRTNTDSSGILRLGVLGVLGVLNQKEKEQREAGREECVRYFTDFRFFSAAAGQRYPLSLRRIYTYSVQTFTFDSKTHDGSSSTNELELSHYGGIEALKHSNRWPLDQ